MRYVKWTVVALLALIVFSFLHYTLPQHDVVRIVGVNSQRMDLGENSWFFAAPDVGTNTATGGSRDIKFIQAIQPDGSTMVYRNEDTGWGWPPYFKVNSFDVQAKASDMISAEAAPKWVMITHYGWRNQLFTIFPNAVSLKLVEGPEASVIPWVNIVILSFLALILFMIRRMWLQFRERMIDPAVDSVNETLEAMDDRVDAMTDAVADEAREAKGWLARLFKR